MDLFVQLVVFSLDGQRYALRLSAVERIVSAVEITPLPVAPEIVLGMINVEGRIVPVINIRKRFRLPEMEMRLSDHLIIARTVRRRVAFLADSVSGLIEVPLAEVIGASKILPRIAYVEGVAKLKDGMALIHDLDGFLSLEEEKKIDEMVSR
ncbi:MAG: purine-binding chemotaxis protein CheW [Deltaproteobacteria bacterium]|nr:purine-binding chemotaxis protein CheW [Deltaproteobacteria bacterium]